MILPRLTINTYIVKENKDKLMKNDLKREFIVDWKVKGALERPEGIKVNS